MKIATLGPRGTFSDCATASYLASQPLPYQVTYYDSIKKAVLAVGTDCDYGVVPIENLSEGFVQPVLDLLVYQPVFIIHEILLPIHFAFVSKGADKTAIAQVYAQFVAKGQCSEFLDRLPPVTLITTESNIDSLNLALEAGATAGAVVPRHAVNSQDFPIFIDNINDFKHNQTRFFVLSHQEQQTAPLANVPYKTSLVILDDDDHPGLLAGILTSFSSRSINLTSIMSRPTKELMGRYHFFIDIEGHQSDSSVAAALAEISSCNRVKVLGSYPMSSQF